MEKCFLPKNKTRMMENVEPKELDQFKANFLIQAARKQNRNEKGLFISSLDHYLK